MNIKGVKNEGDLFFIKGWGNELLEKPAIEIPWNFANPSGPFLTLPEMVGFKYAFIFLKFNNPIHAKRFEFTVTNGTTEIRLKFKKLAIAFGFPNAYNFLDLLNFTAISSDGLLT